MTQPKLEGHGVFVDGDGRILERAFISEHGRRDWRHAERHISRDYALTMAALYLDAARAAKE